MLLMEMHALLLLYILNHGGYRYMAGLSRSSNGERGEQKRDVVSGGYIKEENNIKNNKKDI